MRKFIKKIGILKFLSSILTLVIAFFWWMFPEKFNWEPLIVIIATLYSIFVPVDTVLRKNKDLRISETSQSKEITADEVVDNSSQLVTSGGSSPLLSGGENNHGQSQIGNNYGNVFIGSPDQLTKDEPITDVERAISDDQHILDELRKKFEGYSLNEEKDLFEDQYNECLKIIHLVNSLSFRIHTKKMGGALDTLQDTEKSKNLGVSITLLDLVNSNDDWQKFRKSLCEYLGDK